MRSIRIVFLLFILTGAGLFVLGNRLDQQANRMENRISQSEQELQNSRKPVIGPFRKGMQANAQENAQTKISSAEGQASVIQGKANWYHRLGFTLIIVGMSSFLVSLLFRKKKR
jgi:predicted PurR-regulated permease PerM